MGLSVIHENSNTGNGRGLSGVFRGLDLHLANRGVQGGIFVDEDFIGNSDVAAGNYRKLTFTTGLNDGVDVASDLGGAVALEADTGEEVSIQTPLFCKITNLDSSVDNTKAGFEVRVKVSDVSECIVVFGLTDGVDQVTIVDGVYDANAFVGLVCGLDGSIGAYREDTQIGDDSSVVIADDTWIKFSARIENRSDGTGPEIKLYANGVEVATISRFTDSGLTAPDSLSGFIYAHSAGDDNLLTVDRMTFAADEAYE